MFELNIPHFYTTFWIHNFSTRFSQASSTVKMLIFLAALLSIGKKAQLSHVGLLYNMNINYWRHHPPPGKQTISSPL